MDQTLVAPTLVAITLVATVPQHSAAHNLFVLSPPSWRGDINWITLTGSDSSRIGIST